MAAKGKKKPATAASKEGGTKTPKKQQSEEAATDESESDAEDESSVYDSGDDGVYPDQLGGDDDDDDDSEEDDGDYESEEEEEEEDSDDNGGESSEEEGDGEGFEDQGSSDEDEMEVLKRQARAVDRRGKSKGKAGKNKGAADHDDDNDNSDDDGLEVLDSEGLGQAYENVPRTWRGQKGKRTAGGKSKSKKSDGENAASDGADPATSQWMHTDDLSSDDEDADGTGNRIGRVPLHWYEDYDHIGYDAHGGKVVKQGGGASGGGDMLDEAIRQSDNVASGKFVVHDALNARDVELTPRQIELIRRIQSGELHTSLLEYMKPFLLFVIGLLSIEIGLCLYYILE
jgi:ribosome biogenesis protein ERB1